MRNAGFHQGKNEQQWKKKKEVNRNTCIQHFLIKCVTRIEFVKVSRTKKRAALAIFLPNQTYCCCCFFFFNRSCCLHRYLRLHDFIFCLNTL